MQRSSNSRDALKKPICRCVWTFPPSREEPPTGGVTTGGEGRVPLKMMLRGALPSSPRMPDIGKIRHKGEVGRRHRPGDDALGLCFRPARERQRLLAPSGQAEGTGRRPASERSVGSWQTTFQALRLPRGHFLSAQSVVPVVQRACIKSSTLPPLVFSFG